VKSWLSLAAAVTLLTLVQSASAQSPLANWGQWRGPLGTGAAPHGNPPTEWSETKHVQWKVKIPGDGTSTPVVWGDKVFVLTAGPAKELGITALPRPENSTVTLTAFQQPPGKGKGGFPGGKKGGSLGSPPPTEPYQFVLLCLDRNSGKTLWQKVASEQIPHEGKHPNDGSFAAHSAATDGEHVIAFFGSRGLACYDLSGNLKWKKDLGQQKTRNGFGEGATPALFGNYVVVPWDHEGEDFIAVFDKRTGDEVWRQTRDEPTGWSTPLVVEHGGKAEVVTLGTNRCRSYDLATGKQIWECEGLTTNVIPSPVAANGVVYATSGYQGYKLLAIRLGSTGDLTGTKAIAWRLDRDTPYVASPLLSGERLYFFKSRNSLLTCLDIRTGQPHYSAQRIDDLGPDVYASPVAAAGRVYLVGRTGACVVLKDADQLEVLATNKLDERIDASPAIVGKQLFLRSHQSLYCIAEK
jgi:outer membrane protein assembly factor BamB